MKETQDFKSIYASIEKCVTKLESILNTNEPAIVSNSSFSIALSISKSSSKSSSQSTVSSPETIPKFSSTSSLENSNATNMTEQWFNHAFQYCAKLLDAIDSYESAGKKLKVTTKSPFKMDRLLFLLCRSQDIQTSTTVLAVIARIYERGTSKYKIEILKTGLLTSLFESMKTHSTKPISECMPFYNIILPILSRLALRDKKFAVKARFVGVLDIVIKLFVYCYDNNMMELLDHATVCLNHCLQNDVNAHLCLKNHEITDWLARVWSQIDVSNPNVTIEKLYNILGLVFKLCSSNKLFDENNPNFNITSLIELFHYHRNVHIRKTILEIIANVIIIDKLFAEFITRGGIQMLLQTQQMEDSIWSEYEKPTVKILKNVFKNRPPTFWPNNPEKTFTSTETAEPEVNWKDYTKEMELLGGDVTSDDFEQMRLKVHSTENHPVKSTAPFEKRLIHIWANNEQTPIQKPCYNADFAKSFVSNCLLLLLAPSRVTCVTLYDRSLQDPLCVTNRQVHQRMYPEEKLLAFESRFESGNLEKAVYMGNDTYYLFLSSDIGTQFGKHHQWFYFEISNTDTKKVYTFHILNFIKPASSFEEGMQPVFYSEKMAAAKRQGWYRLGDKITYYKNAIQNPVKPNTYYYAAAFEFKCPYDDDKCSFAYHFPYTYSDLQVYLDSVQRLVCAIDSEILYLRQTLCYTDGGNAVDLLTITSKKRDIPIEDRKYILLTARVHPGESNSSYVMEGIMHFLLGSSEEARRLREHNVFKIVPMLNPDGVIEGSHRCSLTGLDLNRQWATPTLKESSTIWYVKSLYEHLVKSNVKIPVSIDVHGHSRKNNIFVFGCPNTEVESIEKIFTLNLQQSCDSIDPSNCKYGVQPSKKTTARIVLWKELKIPCSVTIETSYLGCTIGSEQGNQWSITSLQRSGCQIGYGIERFLSNLNSIPSDQLYSTFQSQVENTFRVCNNSSQSDVDQNKDDNAIVDDDLDLSELNISSKKGSLDSFRGSKVKAKVDTSNITLATNNATRLKDVKSFGVVSSIDNKRS